MAPHGLHSFFRVLGAHAFERLVDQIHVPSFEIKVLVLLRIGVVRGVLRIFSFCSCGGSQNILNIAQRCAADNVAFDVRLPADGVAVPLLFSALCPLLQRGLPFSAPSRMSHRKLLLYFF